MQGRLSGSAPTRLACYDAKAAYFITLMECSYGSADCVKRATARRLYGAREMA